MIETGEIGPEDQLSLAGAFPRKYWEYRPFEDLHPDKRTPAEPPPTPEPPPPAAAEPARAPEPPSAARPAPALAAAVDAAPPAPNRASATGEATDTDSDAPGSPETSADPDAASEESDAAVPQIAPFPEELIVLGGVELRRALVGMPPEEILGVTVSSPRKEMVRAYKLRRAQLDEHRDNAGLAAAQRVAMKDTKRILSQSAEFFRDVPRIREYHTRSREKGAPLQYGEFFDFQPTLHDQSVLDFADTFRQSSIRSAQEREAELRESRAEAAVRELDLGAMSTKDLLHQASNVIDMLAEERELEPMTPEQRKKEEARRLVARTPDGLTGTPTSGGLVWGIGIPRRAAATVLPMYGLVFVAALIMILVTNLDAVETRYDSGSVLQLIRAVLMLGGATIGLMVFRGEQPRRLGWKPQRPEIWFVIPLAVAIGAAGGTIIPFQVDGEPALQTVLVFIVLRAFAEAVFFEGLVTRTFLIESDKPLAPLFVSASLYGIYINTYRFIWDPNGEPSSFGVVFHILCIGLPAAYAYYRTRAIWAPALCRAAALGVAAALAIGAS